MHRSGLKRKLIQIAAFGFSNANVKGLKDGTIYTGSWKNFCNPGMNCYSCPAAGLSCPIGAIQAVSSSFKYKFSFYAVGIILALGTIFGRWICGFLCPFGLIQELISAMPIKKHKLPHPLRYLKYFLLIIFVLLLPAVTALLYQAGDPTFCKYICPVGMIEGALPLLILNKSLTESLGPIFLIKSVITVLTILGCIYFDRFFCKLMCPLGAIYGLLNKISIYRMYFNNETCIGCGKCAHSCPMDVDPSKVPNSVECIRCGKCTHNCPTGSLTLSFTSPNCKTDSIH